MAATFVNAVPITLSLGRSLPARAVVSPSTASSTFLHTAPRPAQPHPHHHLRDHRRAAPRCSDDAGTAAASPRKRSGSIIAGRVFVVGDNIDTDQIIPAEYLTLVPSRADEYVKLGSYALSGLPAAQYTIPYVEPGEMQTQYPIVVAGANFGCGSSREHAPVSMGAAGGVAVVAASYARIFFRNCSATGELYPWECEADGDFGQKGLVDCFETGDQAEIDFDSLVVRNVTQGKEYRLKELGDVLPVVDAGGIFEFARRSGMISSAPTE